MKKKEGLLWKIKMFLGASLTGMFGFAIPLLGLIWNIERLIVWCFISIYWISYCAISIFPKELSSQRTYKII